MPNPAYRLPDTGHDSNGQIDTNYYASVSFDHVINGNYALSHVAIEAFLKSQGFGPQGHYAELIMFLERSFAGKYRKGESSHYQRLMPAEGWRKGDTLSEKLTRCKDKETFLRRFGSFGRTDILRREHFKGHKIVNLDFEGKLYLRFLDTTRQNLSRFYRNDLLVREFIADALLFHKEQAAEQRRQRIAEVIRVRKPEEVSIRNAEVLCGEIPNSLLTDEVNRKETVKRRRDSLTLIYPSPDGTTQKSNLDGLDGHCADSFDPADWVGLKSPRPLVPIKSTVTQHAPKTGEEIYHAWRGAVLAHYPDEFISVKPTTMDISNAKTMGNRLEEMLPGSKPVDFFLCIASDWLTAKTMLDNKGAWTKANYPQLPWLAKYSSLVLTWYKNKRLSDEEYALEICNDSATQNDHVIHQQVKAKIVTATVEKPATYEEVVALKRQLFGKR